MVLWPGEENDAISAMDISKHWPAQGLLRCRIPELDHVVFADGDQQGFLVLFEGCECTGRKKAMTSDGCPGVMPGYRVEDVQCPMNSCCRQQRIIVIPCGALVSSGGSNEFGVRVLRVELGHSWGCSGTSTQALQRWHPVATTL